MIYILRKRLCIFRTSSYPSKNSGLKRDVSSNSRMIWKLALALFTLPLFFGLLVQNLGMRHMFNHQEDQLTEDTEKTRIVFSITTSSKSL